MGLPPTTDSRITLAKQRVLLEAWIDARATERGDRHAITTALKSGKEQIKKK
jgi:hypothetical protein